ncbi:hypothetical protein [Psychrobacter sp. WY6]|uniref:hypothetical protein n=1 Tax=Psychrobacter sp. WY6 TaxID=2708350 RepID=UPI0020231069|nr:hypothetical protein [Psychrobacter sp. WY6]
MNNSKAILSVLLFTLSINSAPVLYAAPNEAIDSTSDMQSRSVEDLVAIAKRASLMKRSMTLYWVMMQSMMPF